MFFFLSTERIVFTKMTSISTVSLFLKKGTMINANCSMAKSYLITNHLQRRRSLRRLDGYGVS
jgi:hypothetical protein